MHEVHRLHRDIFKLIEDQGGEFSPHPSLTDTRCDQGHQCFCGRHFTTAQGLALHRRKAHDIHAPEYRLVDGATCPCCLKFFWTSQRLYQHLAYRKTLRNPCFQQLMKNGCTIEFESQRLPNHVHGLGRVDALQTYGPQPELANQADIRKARAQDELTDCLEVYQMLQQTECPIDVEAHCTTQTWAWFQEFVAQGQTQDGLLSLEDRLIGELADLVSEIQGRPMKAAWFDALVFDPHFGGQNCLSVVQALQAELGNLMAVRQNLCVQISVCWFQCLIELAGKELVIFKFDF